MSMEQVTCPKCGRKLQAEVLTVLRDDDEMAWKALVSGKLNTCCCPDCGTSFMIERPLVYRDEKNPFIVYYMETPDDDTHELEEQIDEMARHAADNAGIEKPVVRLTLTLTEFVEKIFLWRLGYDDRLVEYTKQQLFRNIEQEKMSRLQHRLLMDFSNEDPEKLAFIIYDRESNKPVGALHVPMEEFRKLVDEFNGNEQLLRELDLLFPTCYVSVDRLF